LGELENNYKLKNPAKVLEDYYQGNNSTRIIVKLVDPEKGDKEEMREQINKLQNQTIGSINTKHIKIRYRYKSLSGFSADVTTEGLEALLKDSNVVSIYKPVDLEANTREGVPLIHADQVRIQYSGAGVGIAVLDSGIDANHPNLQGRVTHVFDYGDNDSNPAPNGNAHGTNIAGIIAGSLSPNVPGGYNGGVAPGAMLYNIKITVGSTNGSNSEYVNAALDWCITNKDSNPNFPIRIVNLSYSAIPFQNQSACDLMDSLSTQAIQNPG